MRGRVNDGRRSIVGICARPHRYRGVETLGLLLCIRWWLHGAWEAAGHTCGRLSGLVGLTMSSVAGDRISLMLSSLTWFSCASSSICSGVSPARCNAQGRALPRCGRCCRCHCCQRATGRPWPDMGWAAQGGRTCLKTWADPLAGVHAWVWWWPATHGVAHLFEKTCANGAGELGESV
jgi:hypothetical protein